MKKEIIEIADSLSKKQRKEFLELTEKVNLLNERDLKFFDLSPYVLLLSEINSLYDGKIDYIKKALEIALKHKKLKMQADKIISEFVKTESINSSKLGAVGIATMENGDNGIFIEIDGHQFKFTQLGTKNLIEKLNDILKKCKELES